LQEKAHWLQVTGYKLAYTAIAVYFANGDIYTYLNDRTNTSELTILLPAA
jgi:hypothetical protein